MENFWNKVNKTISCWLWTASVDSSGYGHIRFNGPVVKAHRVSWQLYYGKIPKGFLVCHKCDNPKCVNPDHLFLGTAADNAHDRDKKGRTINLKGELHGMAKLTKQKVFDLMALHKTGKFTYRDLGKRYKISPTTVYKIIKRRIWKSL